MSDDQPVVGGVASAVDIVLAPSLEALATEMASSMKRQAASEGLFVRSISHAFNPEDAKNKWSAILFYGPISAADVRLKPAK